MSKNEKPILNLWAEPQKPIRKMRLAVRLWALLALAVSFQIWHYYGSWGALGGALLVEINLDIFIWSLEKNQKQKVPQASLKGTLVKFYILMALTALACFFFIKFNLGHPFAFLAGLSTFFLGLVSTILAYVLYFQRQHHGQR